MAQRSKRVGVFLRGNRNTSKGGGATKTKRGMGRTRTRSGALGLLAAAAAAATALLNASAFVGIAGPMRDQVSHRGEAVTMHSTSPKRMPWNFLIREKYPRLAWKTPKNLGPNKQLTAKEKQAQRSKAQNKVPKSTFTPAPWPMVVPPGITVLHLELGEDLGTFPGKGSFEAEMLSKELVRTFGSRVRLMINNNNVLKRISPIEVARKGAFEIVDVKRAEVLFSRLQSQSYLYRDILRVEINKLLQNLKERVDSDPLPSKALEGDVPAQVEAAAE